MANPYEAGEYLGAFGSDNHDLTAAAVSSRQALNAGWYEIINTAEAIRWELGDSTVVADGNSAWLPAKGERHFRIPGPDGEDNVAVIRTGSSDISVYVNKIADLVPSSN